MDVMNKSDLVNETYSQTSGGLIVDFRQFYQYGFEFILYGYFMPVWSAISIIIYTLMIIVFIKYRMTTKTHVCLIAIAICDIMSPIAPTVTRVYFFAIRKYYYYLPFEWCRTYHYTTQIIPQIFGYSSYFITVMMAVQRYIVVAHPFRAKQLCSTKIVYCLLAFCILLSTAIRFLHFFHYKYNSKTVPKEDNRNETMEACVYQGADWIPTSFVNYIGIVAVVNTFVLGIIPCTILIVSELLMLKAVNASSSMRQNLTRKTNKRLAQRERRLTIATILITAVTLFYMVPVVVIHAFDVFSLMFGLHIGNKNDLRTTVVVINVTYWICIPSNFLITCCLSEEFRHGIRHFLSKPKSAYPRNLMINTITGNT